MTAEPNWSQVKQHLNALYEVVDGLETMFPGRKFTPDGHLVGSLGEVVGAYMFDLVLHPASTEGHDATTRDGRQVQIKLTQGTRVGIRHEADVLIVLHRPKEGPLTVVYNGPGEPVWRAAVEKQSNGQRPIALSKLRQFALSVPINEQLPTHRQPPI